MNAWTTYTLPTTNALAKNTSVDTEYSSHPEGVQQVIMERPFSVYIRLRPVTSPKFVVRLRVRKIDG